MTNSTKKESAREKYGDIIDLPHHQSKTHPRMSMYARAAQFAPFAAVAGYGDMVKEAARETEQRETLSEEDMRVLNQKLMFIREAIALGNHPQVTIRYFIPDALKSGGRYEVLSGTVKKVDITYRRMVFYGGNGIFRWSIN